MNRLGLADVLDWTREACIIEYVYLLNLRNADKYWLVDILSRGGD